MEELANLLQVWQSAMGTLIAIAVFVASGAAGRQLAEDVVLAFAAGAITGSAGALATAFWGIS